MKKLLIGIAVLGLCAAFTAMAWAEAPLRTVLPEGGEISLPGGDTRVPCDQLIRYDDGSDDAPGSGPTLADFGDGSRQYLGVIFTAPAGGEFQVQSASWFSDFWVWPGTVNVSCYEIADPSNAAAAAIDVTGGGTWEVEFSDPICVPGGTDYVVMLCPVAGVWGVVGEDYAAPDGRSYWSAATCDPLNSGGGVDYMIWSCVTPCGPVPVENTSWGTIKGLYH